MQYQIYIVKEIPFYAYVYEILSKSCDSLKLHIARIKEFVVISQM